MARPKLNLVVLDPGSGRARPGAWVSLYFANTLSFAPLYADDDLSAIANPVQANALGQVAVRVPPGIYDISMTWDGAQPTLVEDVLAWTPDQAYIQAPGDIVIGGPGGSAIRLPVGDEGEVLSVVDGLPDWEPLGPGAGFPAGVPGSLLVYPPAPPGLDTIPPGTDGQFFVMLGGVPTWATHLPAPPGTLLPINTKGDLVIGDPAGLPMRLPIGATAQVLTVVGGTAVWQTPALPPEEGFESPMTTLGDLIVGGVAGVGERLGIGPLNAVLTVVGGIPTWTVPVTPLGKIMVFLTAEGARLPDGTAGNTFPTAHEVVSLGTPPVNTVRIVDFLYKFDPVQQQSLIWKAAAPSGWNSASVEIVVKWRSDGILGQVRWRAALAGVVDAGTDLVNIIFNPATLTVAEAVPGTVGQTRETRFAITDLTNVAVGRMLYVMLGCLEAVSTSPGLIFFEEAWLEFSR